LQLVNRKNHISKQDILSVRVVLDRSGSMAGSQKVTMEALNTYLTDLRREKSINALLTLSTFDSISIDIPISRVSIKRFESFPEDLVKPRGRTPLFDAIGLAIHDLENIEESTDENKVLVIVTDGFENASKEYTFENIS
jgi:Mg-chelatase subunit ChlD